MHFWPTRNGFDGIETFRASENLNNRSTLNNNNRGLPHPEIIIGARPVKGIVEHIESSPVDRRTHTQEFVRFCGLTL